MCTKVYTRNKTGYSRCHLPFQILAAVVIGPILAATFNAGLAWRLDKSAAMKALCHNRTDTTSLPVERCLADTHVSDGLDPDACLYGECHKLTFFDPNAPEDCTDPVLDLDEFCSMAHIGEEACRRELIYTLVVLQCRTMFCHKAGRCLATFRFCTDVAAAGSKVATAATAAMTAAPSVSLISRTWWWSFIDVYLLLFLGVVWLDFAGVGFHRS